MSLKNITVEAVERPINRFSSQNPLTTSQLPKAYNKKTLNQHLFDKLTTFQYSIESLQIELLTFVQHPLSIQ